MILILGILAACQILVHASLEGDIPIVIPFDAYDIGKLSGIYFWHDL
ncbi:hypothetical protein WJX79_000641 [Trebouxia sp. C0005]